MSFSPEADELVTRAKSSLRDVARFNNTETLHGRRMARAHAQELYILASRMIAALEDETEEDNEDG